MGKNLIPHRNGRLITDVYRGCDNNVVWKKMPQFWLQVGKTSKTMVGRRKLVRIQAEGSGAEFLMTMSDYVDMADRMLVSRNHMSGTFGFVRSSGLTTIRMVRCDHGGGLIASRAPFVGPDMIRADIGGPNCVFKAVAPFAAEMRLGDVHPSGGFATVADYHSGTTYPMRLAELSRTLKADKWRGGVLRGCFLVMEHSRRYSLKLMTCPCQGRECGAEGQFAKLKGYV